MKRILALVLLVVFIAGCTPPGSEEKSIKVTDLEWVIENIDPSYWSSTPSSTCFYYFWIDYEGSNIALSDIEYARVYTPENTWWNFSLVDYKFDGTNQYIGGGLFSFNSVSNVLPIGDLKAEIKLKNGQVSSFTQTIPAPGQLTTNGYAYVYTEDYSGTPPANYTPMIPRASIVSAANSGTAISIDFNVTDSNVYNGYVWFYNSTDDYVGRSLLFRDYTNGNLSSIINNGSVFNTDGTNNTVTIASGDITFQSGYSFADIANFHLLLTDGAQYAGLSYIDCRSISAYTAIP